MIRAGYRFIRLWVFFTLIGNLCLSAQESSTHVRCESGGCVTNSNVTLIGVTPAEVDGDPATVFSGQTFEVCYEVRGWNYININWFHGAEPVVGSALIPPDENTVVTKNQGVAQNWIWNSYCTTNCCDGAGDNTTYLHNNVCGPPATGAWLFGVDSGQTVCEGGFANDGETSNNWGDSGSGPFEFCIEIKADCGNMYNGYVDSSVGWNVYSDGDMGSWGYGQTSNNCGCEGGALECSIDLKVICPTIAAESPNEDFASGIEELENEALVYYQGGQLYFSNTLERNEILESKLYDLNGRLLQIHLKSIIYNANLIVF